MISGPQGPRVVLDGKPVLLLCSNNYLGLADHPRVREAAADAAMRWGVGAGSVAAGLGDDADPPPARGAARRVQGRRDRAAVRLGLPGEHRRRQRARRQGRGRLLRRAQPRVDHRRLPALAGARRSSTATTTSSTSPGRCERAERPRRADRHRLGVLDGRRRRAAGRDRRARAAPRRARSSSTRRTASAASGPAAAARSTRPGSSTRSTSSSARSARRSAPTAPT